MGAIIHGAQFCVQNFCLVYACHKAHCAQHFSVRLSWANWAPVDDCAASIGAWKLLLLLLWQCWIFTSTSIATIQCRCWSLVDNNYGWITISLIELAGCEPLSELRHNDAHTITIICISITNHSGTLRLSNLNCVAPVVVAVQHNLSLVAQHNLSIVAQQHNKHCIDTTGAHKHGLASQSVSRLSVANESSAVRRIEQ